MDWRIGGGGMIGPSDADAVPVHRGEERAECKSKAVSLLVNLHSYPYL